MTADWVKKWGGWVGVWSDWRSWVNTGSLGEVELTTGVGCPEVGVVSTELTPAGAEVKG